MIELGSNPSGFLGFSYSKCNYVLRDKGNPLITIHFVFFVIWINLPFKHISERGHGTAIESYGFVVSLKRKYAHIKNGFKYKRIF